MSISKDVNVLRQESWKDFSALMKCVFFCGVEVPVHAL